jgi:ribosomal protein L40E
MAVMAVGIFFIVLGIYSIVIYFSAVYNVPDSHSAFGVRYVVAGGACIAIGIGALRMSVPAFIPIKQNSLPTIRTCPYCGAVTETDATYCKKCKRELD